MNNNNDYAIVAEGLTKQFCDFIATNHITFQVHRGEIFGFCLLYTSDAADE